MTAARATGRDITYKFITDINPKPGNAYGLLRCYKENRPQRIIAPGCNTAFEIYYIGSRTN